MGYNEGVRAFFFFFLIPCLAFAESPFRDPVEFLRKNVMDFSAGPGYTVGENIRVHNKKSGKRTGTTQSFFPLYDFRIGPVNITNSYSQPNFTRGRGLRLGLLFNYTGDEYEADSVSESNKTLFGGGFAGYGMFTFYAYGDMLKKKAGVLYAFRVAPMLFKFGRHEFFAIFELQHMNRLYVHKYFGVRNYEGTPKIPAYEGVATENYSGTLLYNYLISKNTTFLFWGGEKRYGPGVTDSPTVGLKHEYSAGIGFLFRII